MNRIVTGLEESAFLQADHKPLRLQTNLNASRLDVALQLRCELLEVRAPTPATFPRVFVPPSFRQAIRWLQPSILGGFRRAEDLLQLGCEMLVRKAISTASDTAFVFALSACDVANMTTKNANISVMKSA